jgi:hypothetical protein
MATRDDLQEKWQANERELNRLYGLSPLFREMSYAPIDQLESEQDTVEFEIADHDVPPRSRKWSGMP